jgi:ankyrin repeat protein
MVAAANAPLATVELLWSNGAEVGNALPCAARSKVPGRFEVIRFLLDNGAPIDAVEYEHNTYGFGSDFVIGSALNLAVCYGGDDTVELLLERGARIDIVDFDGRSALELARKFGSPKKVELLEKRLRLDRTKSGREITYWQADLINGPGGEKVELVPFAKGGDGVKGA